MTRDPATPPDPAATPPLSHSAPHPPARPNLGFGLGLRKEHYQTILDLQPSIDWFEILSENYMVPGGKPLHYLERIREHWPVVMHGVSLSIGSTDPLDRNYLKDLRALAQRVEPEWISDHLCWTSQGGINSHDLLPLPATESALRHVAERIDQVQNFLGRQILIENLSSYVSFRESDMTEWEFLDTLAERADCLILLDINNIYVSARNHRFDPRDYLRGIRPERVRQFHLAGHTDTGDLIIDTHDAPICASVWDLYREALQHFGPTSTMIERDGEIPPFEELRAELAIAEGIANEVAMEGLAPGEAPTETEIQTQAAMRG